MSFCVFLSIVVFLHCSTSQQSSILCRRVRYDLHLHVLQIVCVQAFSPFVILRAWCYVSPIAVRELTHAHVHVSAQDRSCVCVLSYNCFCPHSAVSYDCFVLHPACPYDTVLTDNVWMHLSMLMQWLGVGAMQLPFLCLVVFPLHSLSIRLLWHAPVAKAEGDSADESAIAKPTSNANDVSPVQKAKLE